MGPCSFHISKVCTILLQLRLSTSSPSYVTLITWSILVWDTLVCLKECQWAQNWKSRTLSMPGWAKLRLYSNQNNSKATSQVTRCSLLLLSIINLCSLLCNIMGCFHTKHLRAIRCSLSKLTIILASLRKRCFPDLALCKDNSGHRMTWDRKLKVSRKLTVTISTSRSMKR